MILKDVFIMTNSATPQKEATPEKDDKAVTLPQNDKKDDAAKTAPSNDKK
jgi:hypothetical protein